MEDAAEERVGQRGKREEVERPRRRIVHPHVRECAGGLRVGCLAQALWHVEREAELVALQPGHHPLHRQGGQCLRCRHSRRLQRPMLPALAPLREHDRGRRSNARVGLRQFNVPMLGGAVRLDFTDGNREVALRNRGTEVDGQRQRRSRSPRMLHRRAQQGGGRHAAERPGEIPVVLARAPGEGALARRLQGCRPVKGVGKPVGCGRLVHAFAPCS